jgi:hypothetical protein
MAFIVNPRDPGLLRSLAALSAGQASERRDGRSSVAAHVQHLRFGFSLMNRWVRGDANAFADANYSQSWGTQQVDDRDWRALREGLAREVTAWTDAIAQPREWDQMSLSAAISAVAHTAYHAGAIRQLAPAAAGPRAAD